MKVVLVNRSNIIIVVVRAYLSDQLNESSMFKHKHMYHMYLAFFLQHYRQAWDVFKKTSVDIGVAGDENGRPVELPTEDKDSERLSFLKRNGVDAD